MFCLTVLYPNTKDASFNLYYYLNTHTPMAIEKLTPLGLKRLEITSGSTTLDGSEPPYSAICNLYFESMRTLEAALQSAGPALQADIPNYCSVMPVFQLGEVTTTYNQ